MYLEQKIQGFTRNLEEEEQLEVALKRARNFLNMSSLGYTIKINRERYRAAGRHGNLLLAVQTVLVTKEINFFLLCNSENFTKG